MKMTKQEILSKHSGEATVCFIEEVVYPAMDEYAKQVAIDFALKVIGTITVGKEREELMCMPGTIEKRFELYLLNRKNALLP